MVALEKYHDVTEAFVAAIEEGGSEIRVCDRALYMYEQGAWSLVSPTKMDDLDRTLRSVCDDNNFPYAEKHGQIWRHVRSSLPLLDPDALDASGLIAIRNGTLDPRDGTLSEHDPEDLTTRRADVVYDPKAKCPHWLRMLDRMLEGKSEKDRKEYAEFLQQWFGLALVGYRNFGGRQYRKLVALYGPERSGKTTVADVLRRLIGDQDVATEDFEQLSGRFGLANVVKARALVADDAVGLKSKANAAVLKKLITGEPMTADRKMREAINFRFNGPILITANMLPRIEDATHALYGRCVVLTLERQFSREDANEHFEGCRTALEFLEKKKEFPGILNWALKGLAKVTEMGGLPDVADASDAGNAWRSENDPVFAFLRDHCEYDPKVLNYVTPVAAAISVYAEIQMADRGYPPKRCKTLVGREAKNVIPGVVADRRSLHKVQNRCLVGLKITQDGMEYVKKALEKGLLETSARWVINDRAL